MRTFEDLPLKYVSYPSSYGAFIGFSESSTSNLLFCSCSKEAIRNALSLNKLADFSGAKADFPSELADTIDVDRPPVNIVLSNLQFNNKICHECNKKTPSIEFCHSYYGGRFKRKYGWYIEKKFYEYGLRKNWTKGNFFIYIPELVPYEILEIIQEIVALHKRVPDFDVDVEENSFLNTGHQFIKLAQKRERDLERIVENEVRLHFGHKKVGEQWTSETILFYLVESLYQGSGKKVIRHHRPAFLDGLELDIFIEKLRLGIEYQGQQHFKPVKHWGGEEGFKKQVERDNKKKELCKANDIKLIYFNYKEELSTELVKRRIDTALHSIE